MSTRGLTPRTPFDQGLFLAHLNKGKEYYDQKRFDEAERELEEAYLLRPRDQKVLNLLGLVYFKQEKYEKAEEVYRKLIAESPEAHTLYYNLGLIHLKLQRLEEAESSFLKSLELARDNPKINFYLGSIYEKQRRFPDAIYQYRQAGATIMVRRVEDKMAAATTRPPLPARPLRGDDTARFKTAEVRESIRRRAEEALGGGPRAVQPPSDTLMAEPAAAPDTSDTNRVRVADVFQMPGGQRAPEIRSFLQQRGGPEASGAGGADRAHVGRRAEDSFRFLENNLMEINFSGKVFIKQGTIYSYSGNLTFWVKEKRPGNRAALVIITGTGRLILTDRHREITFMQVHDETVYVEPSHLLACEETLTPNYVFLGESPEAIEFLALEGNGMVALSVASKPLPLSVTPDLPVSVPSASVITWSGDLVPQAIEDEELYEVMLPAGSRGPLLRLEGSGRILVEQTLG